MLLKALMILGTALLSILVLFLLTKLMGNKQVSQMNNFDYIIGITIGSIAAELATELEDPVQPLVALIVYGVIAFLISFLTNHFLSLQKLIAGKPMVLLDNGRLYRENMKKARMDLSDFLTICRINGYFNLTEIQTALLEQNGNISFLPKVGVRPATPTDLSLNVSQDFLTVDVILDGKVNKQNLKLAGKNEQWLKTQLKAQGYSDPKKVYLALCDRENNLSVYPIGQKKRKEDPFE